jgi:hypothetical protein
MGWMLIIGWRLSPAIFAHICRGMSMEAAIIGNANITGPFTHR